MERKTFSKSERIRKRRDFERFKIQRGEISRTHEGAFTLLSLPNDLATTRIGIRVGKKIGKAHMRNRIKRLIREVFRQNKDAFPPSSDLLIIVTATPDTLTLKSFVEDIIPAASRLSKDIKASSKHDALKQNRKK